MGVFWQKVAFWTKTVIKGVISHRIGKKLRQRVENKFGYLEQNFTTVLSNGEEVALCPGGGEKQVTKENMNEFIQLVLEARFNEAKEQVAALRKGLDEVF